MTGPDEIKHFLVTYDPSTGETTVCSFGTDEEAALVAYAKAEQDNGLSGPLDVVLLGADSLETIEQTHSSYFNGGVSKLEELLPGLTALVQGDLLDTGRTAGPANELD